MHTKTAPVPPLVKAITKIDKKQILMAKTEIVPLDEKLARRMSIV
jgi:hypothetical protein